MYQVLGDLVFLGHFSLVVCGLMCCYWLEKYNCHHFFWSGYYTGKGQAVGTYLSIGWLEGLSGLPTRQYALWFVHCLLSTETRLGMKLFDSFYYLVRLSLNIFRGLFTRATYNKLSFIGVFFIFV